MGFHLKDVKKLLILLLILPLIGACSKDDEAEEAPERTYYYDPRIPFGNIESSAVQVKDVLNLQIDTSAPEKIRLTWQLPPLYLTMNYEVVIYKRREATNDFNIKCPVENDALNLCPSDASNVAFLYERTRVEGEVFIDENYIDGSGEPQENIFSGSNYSYWVFIHLKDDNLWSKGLRVDATALDSGNTFEFPNINEFWPKLRWTMGQNPVQMPGEPDLTNSIFTFDIGNASPLDFRGRIATASSGNIVYVADTSNNRVLIYTRDGALSCEEFLSDPYLYQACLFQYVGAPLYPKNILGQNDANKTHPCGHPDALPPSQCLNSPRSVSVIGNKLFISDSGSHRIVVYDNLPTDGCIAEPFPGQVRPTTCTPDWVIGKAGLEDANSFYPVSAQGLRSLNNPTDVVMDSGELYIADTGNHRIVKISNYTSRDFYNCTLANWTTPLCQFSAVLGQSTFFERVNFKDEVALKEAELPPVYVIDQTGLKDTLSPSYENFLKRHFSNPMRIVFNKDGKMLIGANEDFEISNSIGGYSSLRGRILIYNQNPIKGPTPLCNTGSFNLGACDAHDVIGQRQFDRLETITNNTPEAYNQLQYGMYGLNDFDVREVEDIVSSTSTEILVSVDSSENVINVWNNWEERIANGYPRSGRVLNPEGVYDPQLEKVMPDLQSICAVKFEIFSNNIFVVDCGGNRFYEVQTFDVEDL